MVTFLNCFEKLDVTMAYQMVFHIWKKKLKSHNFHFFYIFKTHFFSKNSKNNSRIQEIKKHSKQTLSIIVFEYDAYVLRFEGLKFDPSKN